MFTKLTLFIDFFPLYGIIYLSLAAIKITYGKKMGKRPKKRKFIISKLHNIKTLIVAWSVVLGIMILAFIIGRVSGLDGNFAFRIVELIATLAAFVVQSIFSFSVLRYNEDLRSLNNEIKKTSDESNMRAEEFRILQFVASNYTVVDFVDHILLYEERPNYVDNLFALKDARLYLTKQGIELSNVYEKPDDYGFVSVRLPFNVVEGKSVGDISFSRFEFTVGQSLYNFVPCVEGSHSLILHNETDDREEAVVNLIFNKDDGFFSPKEVIPFSNIRIYFMVRSLLGVAVTGRVELYFTNPLKLEKTGENKYTINSSLFEASGIPTLKQYNEKSN